MSRHAWEAAGVRYIEQQTRDAAAAVAAAVAAGAVAAAAVAEGGIRLAGQLIVVVSAVNLLA